jgi:hypothetical protein
MDPLPRCAHCGEVIGAYEPTIVVELDGIIHETSWAAQPKLVGLPTGNYHLACHRALQAAARRAMNG